VKRTAQTAVLVFFCVALLFHGGCTAALWDRMDPEKPVWMPASQVTEEELQAQGLTYRKSQIPLAHPVDGYLVEKTDMQKFRDRVVLVTATPFTVVADGVLFCGCFVVAGTLGDPAALGSWLDWFAQQQ